MKLLLVLSAIFVTKTYAVKTQLSGSVNDRELKRMVNKEHQIDRDLEKFKENLEGLRTTVDFEPLTV